MQILKRIWWAFLGAFLGLIVAFVVSSFLSIIDESITRVTPPIFVILVYLCIPIGAIISTKIAHESQTRKKAEEERRSAILAERQDLKKLLKESRKTFYSLEELMRRANSCLDRAEWEYKEGAFAPFWDEVESAANTLALFHEGVKSISHTATEYNDRASRAGLSIRNFEMPGKLPDAGPVAGRLSRIVYLAQKDIRFSMIFEQRKTNKLLYAGFETLESAIGYLETSISVAFDDLSTALDTNLDDLVSNVEMIKIYHRYPKGSSRRQH